MGAKISSTLSKLADTLVKDLDVNALKKLESNLVGFVTTVASKHFIDNVASAALALAQRGYGDLHVSDILQELDSRAAEAIQFAKQTGGKADVAVAGIFKNTTAHPFVSVVHDISAADVMSAPTSAAGQAVMMGDMTNVTTGSGAAVNFVDQSTGIAYTLPPFWQSRLTAGTTAANIMLAPIINGAQTVGVQFYATCSGTIVNGTLVLGFVIGQLPAGGPNTRVVAGDTYGWAAYAQASGSAVITQLTPSNGANGTTLIQLPPTSLPGVTAWGPTGSTQYGLVLTYVAPNALGNCILSSFVSVACTDTFDSDPDNLPLTITLDGSDGSCNAGGEFFALSAVQPMTATTQQRPAASLAAVGVRPGMGPVSPYPLRRPCPPCRRAANVLQAAQAKHCTGPRVGTLVCAAVIAVIALLIVVAGALVLGARRSRSGTSVGGGTSAVMRMAAATPEGGAIAGVASGSVILVLSAVILGLQGSCA